MDKEVRKLVAQLERQGWRVELRGSGHYLAFSPDGKTIVLFASTPSDHRWRKNTIARLRRGGFDPRKK